ncbi:ABC transporter permease [Comamonadaceae bacterium M7527]|nr:ABC transporter permease [Comamonadaceae bacterium M7527]
MRRFAVRQLNTLWLGVLAAAVGLPAAAALGHALLLGASAPAWHTMLQHPSTGAALALSVATATVSTAICLWLTRWLVFHLWVRKGQHSNTWHNLTRWIPAMLAMPHVAFAMGVVWLIAPSGWLIRLMSPSLTGWQWPPDWPLINDPLGVGLCVVLVGKELPFLLWSLATQLQRPDLQLTLARAMTTATSLGYTPHQAWCRVMWPMLWPKLSWPLLAMFAYGISQVDMALVIGPTQPPTLAVLAWQWLQDPSPGVAASGVAAAWLLSAAGAVVAAVVWCASRWRGWRRINTSGHSHMATHANKTRQATPLGTAGAAATWRGFALAYGAVVFSLAIASVTLYWPFPSLLPQQWHTGAWVQASLSSQALGSTLGLALFSSTLAMLWTISWFEAAPARLDIASRPLLYALLVLPPVLWLSGLHMASVAVGLDATWLGVAGAHTLAVVPYTVLMLSPAYRSYDQRFAQASASLAVPVWRFLTAVKWPMLKAALLNAWAVGFAVSVAQYLPTQMLGAGRVVTVTTEAVTLASGGQRDQASAFGLLQIALPVLAFALAYWLGKSKATTAPTPPTPTSAP